MEELDVFDDNGAWIGVASRSEVHRIGMWHRTVHIYAYRTVGSVTEFAVHLRSLKKDLYPGTWDPVFGGHVKSGSDPVRTAVDELNEEVGILCQSHDLRVGPVLQKIAGNDREFNHLFAYRVTSEFKFSDGEVEEVRWMSLEDILHEMSLFPQTWRPSPEEFSLARSFLSGL